MSTLASRDLFAFQAPDPAVPRLAGILALILALVYFCLATHAPVGLMAYAAHDDGWFFERAHALTSGHWLGQFSQMTLIKGPGYSFFLAANHVLGLPATVTQALLYITACLVFSRAVYKLCGSALLGFGVLALSLFHPAVIPVRLIRDDIYVSQGLLYFGCLIQALFVSRNDRSRGLWALGAGLCFAWLWVTREEGVWVVPATVVLFGARLWRERSYLKPGLVFAASIGVAMCSISILNFAMYRTFSIVDFKSRSYSQAVGALQSVRVGAPVPYVPVPAKVRTQIYAVSPAFRSLQPYFDVYGRVWTESGCQVYPSTCGDYAGGWFVWAFRDAVAAAGHYRTERDAAAFYDQITREVQAACRNGRLTCERSLIAYLPPMTMDQWRQGPSKIRAMIELLLSQPPLPEAPGSAGASQELGVMWRFEGLPRRTSSDNERSLSGWYYGASNTWLQLRCGSGADSWVIPVGQLASQDLVAHFKSTDAAQRRFAITLPPDVDCGVQAKGAGPQDAVLSYAGLTANPNRQFAGANLVVDGIGGGPEDELVRLTHRSIAFLAKVYKAILPVLGVCALVAYLAHLVQLARGTRKIDGFWIVLHALWLAIDCRAAILILVDMSAFPGIVPIYAAALAPLVVSALLMTVYLPFQRKRLAEEEMELTPVLA
ncbi:MAG TPA: hypothetical protein VHY34_01050 [Caulobacteraceae bacterium]|jgi:hypothetical protein|nr:hypothetical protein [Caulobacteraceae bacterium]